MIHVVSLFLFYTSCLYADGYVMHMDDFHSWTSKNIQKISRNTDEYLTPPPPKHKLDKLLQTRRYEALENRTKLHLRTGIVYNKEEGTQTYKSIRARLDLPKLRKRLKLYIEDLQETQNAKVSNTTLQNDASAIGLSLLNTDKEHIRTRFKAGVKFGGFLKHGPNPYARYTIDIPIPHETLYIDASQSFELSHRHKYFQNGSFKIDTPMENSMIRRFLVSYSYNSEHSGINYYVLNSILKQNAKGIGYHVGVSNSGNTSNKQTFNTNSLFFTWYKSLFKDWVFYSIEPRILFQDHYDYKPNPEIGAYLTIIFE